MINLNLNLNLDTSKNKHKFADHRVCKSFLLECCPHDILASTVSNNKLLLKWVNVILLLSQRMDLGECPRRHDLALRADYQKAAQEQEFGYELDVSINHTNR